MSLRAIGLSCSVLTAAVATVTVAQDPTPPRRTDKMREMEKSLKQLERDKWKLEWPLEKLEHSMPLKLGEMDRLLQDYQWNHQQLLKEQEWQHEQLLQEPQWKTEFKLQQLGELDWKVDLGWPGRKLSTGLPEPEPGRQDNGADSLYRRARETLNRGEYRQASELFRTFAQRFPNSRYVPAAMYWQAFSLHRAGTETDLRQALRLLDEQREKYPSAADEREVGSLVTRVVAALAARGDGDAAARLRQGASQGAQSCDREDMEVRSEALSALVQSDPAAAGTVLRRILARRDECSASLRRRAVYLIGREGIGGGSAELIEVAKNDPDQQVRVDAISRLAQMPGGGTAAALEQLFAGTNDEHSQRAILQALRYVDQAEASRILRRALEREDLSESVRIEAVRSFGRHCCSGREKSGQAETRLSESDAAYLRSVYEKSTSRNIKAAILETMARAGGQANDQWLMGIVRNGSEDLRYRNAALTRLQRSDVSVDELAKLYDALSERELRASLVEILGNREEASATDKLFEIVRSGTDPTIRRRAIGVLARKKDPRTTKLLLELVEK